MTTTGSPLVERIHASLTQVIDPELRQPITDLGMVGDVSVGDDGDAHVQIRLTIVGCPAADRIESDVRTAIASVDGVGAAHVDVTVMTPAERTALTTRLRGNRPRGSRFGPDSLTRVIAVTSGKGGVGKSTLTANLAVALASRGLAVGLIDADVHGFSIPGILGIGADSVPTKVGELMLPPVAHGVKTISIGMFLPPAQRGQAVAWRGPMLHRTIAQFVTDVFFGDLDVLLIDMPPGTGDVAISMGQLLPNAEVLVVTTPQAAAAEVAERSGSVAGQTGQRVIGVIENMAGMVQPDGSILEIFGSGGGAATAERLSRVIGAEVPLLGSVPLSIPLRQGGDLGVPIVLSETEDPAAAAIRSIADRLTVRSQSLVGRGLPLSTS